MELFFFNKQVDLDNFVIQASRHNNLGAEYLQSWVWGEILKSEGKEVKRLGIKKNGRIIAAMTVFKRKLFSSYFYWYAPRGPIYLQESARNFLFSALQELDAKAIFCRFEPQNSNEKALFKENKFGNFRLEKTINLQPAQSLFLDLNFSEEKLLGSMHHKTRYNIRLAQRKGVKFKLASKNEIKEFWRLLRTTGERDKFRIHNLDHYQKLLQVDKNFIKLFFTQYQGKNIAAGLFCFWGQRVTYLHGASDNSFRNVMAPYLLQWSVIKLARTEEYLYYDFYGINEQEWPGVSRFKLGFGGQRVTYPGTYDLVFNKGLFKVYKSLRFLRRLI